MTPEHRLAVEIRLARQADAERLAEVHVRSWQAGYRELLPADFLAGLNIEGRAERWLRRLREERPPARTTVAELDGELVGFASVGPSRDEDLNPADWLELNTIYLLPAAWGTGVAGQLLQATLTEERAYFLWVLADNPRAQAFYRKAGFVPDGTSKPITIETTTLTEIRFRRLPAD